MKKRTRELIKKIKREVELNNMKKCQAILAHLVMKDKLIKYPTKPGLTILNLVAICFLMFSCGKEIPPVTDSIFYVEIEITDNAPFKDAAIILAIADENFLVSGNGIGVEDSTTYIFINDTPIYTERNFMRVVPASAQMYLWITTSESPGNIYAIEVFKNGHSIYKSVAETLNVEQQKI